MEAQVQIIIMVAEDIYRMFSQSRGLLCFPLFLKVTWQWKLALKS